MRSESILSNLYIAGINKMLKNRKIGEVEIGRERLWNLAYAVT